MRTRSLLPLLLGLALAGGCGRSRSTWSSTSAILLRPGFARVGLGQRARFTALSAAGAATWSVQAAGGSGVVSRIGEYYAPLRMPDAPTLTIRATTPAATADATVELEPATFDSLACYGLGQRIEATPGEYVFADELPVAIVKVLPAYPDSAREAGVQGQVMVGAHVCACGEVMETYPAVSIPLLDGAAATAVRQWVFEPATIAGEPVAVWVAVPVRFTLH